MTFLNKDIVKSIIENREFSQVEINCEECQNIEDEQYTCCNCWAQGGRKPISAQKLLQDLFDLKYIPEEADIDQETATTFISLYKDYDSADLYYEDYKDTISEEHFNVPKGWKTVSLDDIFSFLTSK